MRCIQGSLEGAGKRPRCLRLWGSARDRLPGTIVALLRRHLPSKPAELISSRGVRDVLQGLVNVQKYAYKFVYIHYSSMYKGSWEPPSMGSCLVLGPEWSRVKESGAGT